MSYNNEMSENANVNENVNISTVDMLEESVSVTVLNRQTNGPIPDYDMDICATNQEVEEVEEAEFVIPPPPRLQRMNCNFVDYTIDHEGRNVFYFAPQVREFTDEEIQIYNEEDENKIYEIEEMEIVEDYPQEEETEEEEMDFDMPTQCPRCHYFDCLSFECSN